MFSNWENELDREYNDDEIDDNEVLRYFSKTFEYKGETFLAGIDMSLTDRSHIISGVYSEYSKHPPHKRCTTQDILGNFFLLLCWHVFSYLLKATTYHGSIDIPVGKKLPKSLFGALW